VVGRLQKECVYTKAHLDNNVTREDLEGRNFPLVIINVLKPRKRRELYNKRKREEMKEVEYSKDRLLFPYELTHRQPRNPPFVCPEHWLADVQAEIINRLEESDDTDTKDDTLIRVPPMAFARCSRGGKTRALREIAYRMNGHDFEAGVHLCFLQ
jgi:hypothetical protein